MKNITIILLVSLVSLVSCLDGNKSEVTISSPNLNVSVLIQEVKGKMFYSVSKAGSQIIEPSQLGVKLKDIDNENLRIANTTISSHNETWFPSYGAVSKIENNYNELIVEIIGDMSFNIIVRVFDDGIGIRYDFLENESKKGFVIEDDLTQFKLATNATVWATNGERHNFGPVNIDSLKKDKVLLTPVVAKITDSCYIGLLEAAISDFDYYKIKYEDDRIFKCKMNSSKGEYPAHTSWRTVIIGNSPGDLMVSNLILNLNPPVASDDVSWIKPGKSMWDWRVWNYKTKDGFTYGLNTTSHLRFIDFASLNNIDYLLMDADWYGAEFEEDSDPSSANGLIDIEKNLKYAKEKGVKIILYLNDIGAKKFGLERILKQFADWGAAGIKYGFMQGHNQEKVIYTRKVIEMCAKYKLLVDFHDEPVPPSGENRTFPNTITREYCHSQADAKRSYWPETAVSSPFINGLAGSLDLCSGWYDLDGAESRERVFEPIPGTVAAENAKLVVNYSGLNILPDSPEEYMKKADLFEFIRILPNTFDDVKIFNDVIGESITVVRRLGEQWFVGSLTNREGRTLNIPLDFLQPGVKYDITLYEDSEDTHFINNKETYRVKRIIGDSKTVLKAKLAPGGGQAIWIRAMK